MQQCILGGENERRRGGQLVAWMGPRRVKGGKKGERGNERGGRASGRASVAFCALSSLAWLGFV